MKAQSQNAKSYAEKLKDPRWQKKRLELLELSDWSCSLCQSKESTLHVHHHQYLNGREPWEYESDQLEVLCEKCHQEEHEDHDILLDVISRLPIDGMKWIDRKKAAYLIAGVLGLEKFDPKDASQNSWFYAGLQVQDLVDDLFQDFLKEL